MIPSKVSVNTVHDKRLPFKRPPLHKLILGVLNPIRNHPILNDMFFVVTFPILFFVFLFLYTTIVNIQTNAPEVIPVWLQNTTPDDQLMHVSFFSSVYFATLGIVGISYVISFVAYKYSKMVARFIWMVICVSIVIETLGIMSISSLVIN